MNILDFFSGSCCKTRSQSAWIRCSGTSDGVRKQVDAWRESQLSDTVAKMIIYRAFIESDLEVPKHLARPVHDLYFWMCCK